MRKQHNIPKDVILNSLPTVPLVGLQSYQAWDLVGLNFLCAPKNYFSCRHASWHSELRYEHHKDWAGAPGVGCGGLWSVDYSCIAFFQACVTYHRYEVVLIIWIIRICHLVIKPSLKLFFPSTEAWRWCSALPFSLSKTEYTVGSGPYGALLIDKKQLLPVSV